MSTTFRSVGRIRGVAWSVAAAIAAAGAACGTPSPMATTAPSPPIEAIDGSAEVPPDATAGRESLVATSPTTAPDPTTTMSGTNEPTTTPPTTTPPLPPTTTPPPSTTPPTPGEAPLDPSTMAYLGAFRVPVGRHGASTFAFGGHGLAYRPGGVFGGVDGLPGTLFAVGHTQEQRVAEVSIPAPVVSKNPADLPVAVIVQPFADVTGGLATGITPDARIGDIEYVESAPGASGPQLHWTVYLFYNVAADQLPGHGVSSPDLANPRAAGGWTLGSYHNQLTGGYLLRAPQTWADAHTGGRSMIAGLNIHQGVASTSQGPALFAFAPWQSPPAAGGALGATPLAYYPHGDGQASTPDPIPAGGRALPGHLIPDRWAGATWVSTGGEGGAGDAVLVVGRRSSGERYGEPEPADCEQDKGYHGAPYRPAFLFYDPADLAAVAAGQVAAWDIRPYAEVDPSADLIATCGWNLTGAAFDPANGLLYVIHEGADTASDEFEPYPVVYVYRVG